MSILSSQLVWLLISYLGTKFVSKTFGRALLGIGRGYLSSQRESASDALAKKLAALRPLTEEERARLTPEERRLVDHASGTGSTPPAGS